jgi:hypothetical protein
MKSRQDLMLGAGGPRILLYPGPVYPGPVYPAPATTSRKNSVTVAGILDRDEDHGVDMPQIPAQWDSCGRCAGTGVRSDTGTPTYHLDDLLTGRIRTSFRRDDVPPRPV